MNNLFKFANFFDKVDKLLEVDCKVRTCEISYFEKACSFFTLEIYLLASQRYTDISTFGFYMG